MLLSLTPRVCVADVNECQSEGVCEEPGRCVNLLGSYRCVCPRGFLLDAGGARCVDRDECAEGACESPCRNYRGRHRCECGAGETRGASGCVPADPCGGGQCGGSACFPVGGAYRCGCPGGYGWDAAHGVCLQLAGGCAAASCLFGCAGGAGGGYECGCPTGYRLVGAGHCLSGSDDDIGGAPVFPVGEQFRREDELLSTEGCFSCKVNGRHRRAPDEGLVFANGTTLSRRRTVRRRRRSSLEPEAALTVVRRPWSARGPLLRLLPAERAASSHFRVSYGDPLGLFRLQRVRGSWLLRLRGRPPPSGLRAQLELEARPGPAHGRSRRSTRQPAPLRLYVSVVVEPRTR